jgi:hypothetical protein
VEGIIPSAQWRKKVDVLEEEVVVCETVTEDILVLSGEEDEDIRTMKMLNTLIKMLMGRLVVIDSCGCSSS